MKLLYVAPVYISEDKPDGVAKKVLDHIAVFSKQFDVYLIYYGDNGIIVKHNNKVICKEYGGSHRRFKLYKETVELAKRIQFEYVYVRYPKSDKQFIDMLRHISKSGASIVCEIPTYPYHGNSTESIKTFAISIVDRVYRKRMRKYVQRILTFSDDDTIFNIPTIRTINGVLFDNIEIVAHKKKNSTINLISVATNYSCHGFDRIIKGMEEYYAKGGKQELIFQIVGNGPAIKDYADLIAACEHVEGKVRLIGYKTGDELKEIYDESDIAVNSLALYRLKLKKESTLKTKEYIAKGLPIISSTIVDGLDDYGNQRFVCLFPDCGDIIDIKSIIDFYHQIYDNKNPNHVSKEIRNIGKEICDMNITMKPVIDYYLGEEVTE